MRVKIFHSKVIVFASIFLFVMLLFSDTFPKAGSSELDEVEKLIQEGKNFYIEGEYDKSLIKFLEAKDLLNKIADETGESCTYRFSRIYLNLALIYFTTNQQDKAQESLKNMFSMDPDMSILEIDYPLGFVGLFNKTKAKFPKPEEGEIGLEPKKNEAQAKEEPEPVVKEKTGKKKKKKFPWLIAGGLAAVGGAAAVLLLGSGDSGGAGGGSDTGSIQVNSTPSGANVYLDSSDTNKTTNCTLSGISAGNHSIKLIKEGFVDYQKSIIVYKGQTATVNANLTKHTITVTQPTANTTWIKGNEAEIEWNTGSSSNSDYAAFSGGMLSSGSEEGINSFSDKREMIIRSRNFRGFSHLRRKTAKKAKFSQERSIEQKVKRMNTKRDAGSIEHHEENPNSNILKGRIEENQFNSLNGMAPQAFQRGITQKNRIKRFGDAGTLTITDVQIDLFKAGTKKETIVSSTTNDGSYKWTVLKSLADGTDYKVKVSCAANTSISDMSPKFQIKSAESISIDWINIPAGSFEMGDNFDEGDSDEKPVHTVYLDAFYISKYEITHEQYIQFLNAVGVNSDGTYNGKVLVDMADTDCAIGYSNGQFYFKGSSTASTKNTPVFEITWNGGKEFCKWLSNKKGKDIDLPTEAQWEKAARGTDQRRYPWGNSSPNCSTVNYNKCQGKVMPVGSYPSGKSPYGVHDMAGNVWEWCQDWYDENYYTSSPTNNPQGPSSGSERVLRGSSWNRGAASIRSANRGKNSPSFSSNYIGLRICRKK